jgi:hypothetical protein
MPFKRLNDQFYLIPFEEESVKDVVLLWRLLKGRPNIELQRELAKRGGGSTYSATI